MDAHVIEAGLQLAGLGWRVVPSSSELKHPPFAGWHKFATSDAQKFVDVCSAHPNCDAISAQWGPSSGVIDLDFDDEESYDRFRLKYLAPSEINGFAAEVRPPMFRSGRRGTPHLIFKFNRRLPEKANVSCRSMGFEIDAKLGWNDLGSQSLVPPSPRYAWEVGRAPWEIEVPELPPLAIDLLLRASRGGVATVVSGVGVGAASGTPAGRQPASPADALPADVLAAIEETGLTVDEVLAMAAESKPAEEWVRIEQGVPEGERHNATLSLVGREARQMDRLSKKKLVAIAVDYAAKCRPPLDVSEAEKIAGDVFEMERRRRHGDAVEQQKAAARSAAYAKLDEEHGELLRQVAEGSLAAEDALRQVAVSLEPFRSAKLQAVALWFEDRVGLEFGPDVVLGIAAAEANRRRGEARTAQAEIAARQEAEEARRLVGELVEPPGQGGEEGGDGEPLLRLERIQCGLDPVEWRLYAGGGLFARTEEGYVPLRTEDLRRWTKVCDAIIEANGTPPIPDDRQAQRTWAGIVQALLATARVVKLPASRSLRALHAQTALDLMHACLQPDDLKDVCVPEIQTGLEAGWQAQYPLAVALPDDALAVSTTALRARMRTVIGAEFDRTILNRLLEAAGAADRPRREVVQAAKRGPLPSSISGSKLAVISAEGCRILSGIADGSILG